MSTSIGRFGVWDYVVFGAMLLISAVIGIYYAFAGGGQKTSKDFLMGGRSMSALPVALSLTASFMSAVTVLGTPAEVYRFGAVFSVFAITYALVVVLSAEIYLPVFYRLGITSTYEYLELRFNKYLRLCGTILFIIQTASKSQIVFLWSLITVGIFFFSTLYLLFHTQGVGIMVAGFSSVIIRAVVVQGGIGPILNDSYHGGRLNFWDFNPNPLQRHTFWTIIIGGTFTWLGIYGVNQSQVQRYIAFFSLYMLLIVHDHMSVSLMPYLVLDILQGFPGMPGLFVASAYSGTLSTVSSSINALAAVTVEDLIKPSFKSLSEKKLSWISKGTSLFYGGLCIAMAALASLLGGLLQAALSIFGMVGGPLLGLFTLGILCPFANPAGAFVGLIGGFTISLWVGIGSQIYHPLPERTMPLNLTTIGCDKLNWTSATEMPIPTTFFLETHAAERPALADYWYSMSYLYFSTLGTLITIAVGIVVSLLTGRKQKVDRKFMLTKDDFLSSFSINRPKPAEDVKTLNWKPFNLADEGTDNPAFNHIEMNFTDNTEKVNGAHI
uniref:Solute carrier family 5 member 8 n=1 Tax=Sphenodon punctatus TaxID=8508 RepID=A0A8D0GH32_SPHPU